MAVLKYKNASGEFVALTNYTVQPIEPVQTTGSSTSEIMSQNAVTSALNTKANSADVYTKTETDTTFLNKTYASDTYLTQLSAQNTYATQTEVNNISSSVTNINSSITNINDSIDAINQEIGLGNTGDTSSSNPIIRQDDLTSYATKTYVDTAVSGLVDGAPETLNTLKELADALGDNKNSVTTITTELGKKANSADVYTKTETYALLDGKANSAHTHAISEVTNLVSTLAAKSDTGHTHSYAGSDSVGGAATSANKVNKTLSWAVGDVNGSFNGSADASFVIPTKVSELTNDSNFITTASTVNTANKVAHSLSISGNGASIASFDGSSDVDINITPSNIGAANVSHTHTISNITDLESTLNSKSDTTHTHTFGDITSKPTTLSGYGITDANGSKITLSSSYVAVTDMPSVGDGNALSASTTGNTLDSVINRIETNIKLVANEVNENEEVAAYALTDLNNRLGEHTEDTDVHISSKERSKWNDIYNFYEGVNTVTSISNVPTSKRLCIVTISTGGTFSLATTPSAGREIHVIVKNTNSSDIIVTIPNGGENVNMSGDSLTVAGSDYAEINVISDGATMYIRTL